MFSNLSDEEYIGKLDELFSNGEIPEEFIESDSITIIEDFENNLMAMNDYFDMLYESFDGIEKYILNSKDESYYKIVEYIKQKKDHFEEIQMQLTLHVDELTEFKEKLIDMMVEQENKLCNTSIACELELHKN